VATASAPDTQSVYAVVRLDSFRNWTPRPENVTVRKVLHRRVDAEYEVRHLNATAPTGTVYFLQRTTVASRGGWVGAPSPAVAIPEPQPPPRSRRERAEKKPAQGPKKGKRK
jgi:hypothetical protein